MMNLNEASRLIGVTPARLRAWVAVGTGPSAIDIGGAPMFDPDAVRSWLRGLPTAEGVPQLPGCQDAGHTLH
jgi:hypothetical protein